VAQISCPLVTEVDTRVTMSVLGAERRGSMVAGMLKQHPFGLTDLLDVAPEMCSAHNAVVCFV
jgi:hypothetical protein